MPDKDMLAFLSGLRVVEWPNGNSAIYTDDGAFVAEVGVVLRHGLGLRYEPKQAASAIVSACHQASRTCETCRFWRAWGPGLGTCSGITSRVAFVRRAADFCSLWEGGKSDDAACND